MRITGLTGLIDTDSIVQSLMLLERRPVLRLQQQRTALDTERAMWEDVLSRLNALRDALAPLLDPATFRARTATSTDTSLVTATASAEATVGSYDFVVDRLATAHRVASDVFADPAADLGLAGSPQINGTAVAITADMDLAEIAAAINAAGAGVRALVVDGQLLLESEATGVANAITVSDDNNVLARLGIIVNHALDQAVAASSQLDADHPAGSVTDGHTGSDLWGSGGGWQDGTQAVFPDTLDIDFGTSKTIDRIRLHTLDSAANPADQYGVKDFNVYYWDGANWQLAESVTGNTAGVVSVDLTSPVTTSKLRIEVTASNDAEHSRVIEVRTYDSSALFKHELLAAQDASFTFNGLAVTRPENTIDDLVDGVTFTLNGTSTSKATVSVTLDKAGIRREISDFISSYNDLYSRLNELLAKGSEFQANGTLMRVQSSLRRLATGSVPTGNPYDQLAMVGITAKGGVDVPAVEQGLLELDGSMLDAALDADPEAVLGLFAATAAADGFDGVAVRLNAQVAAYADDDGILDGRIGGIESEIDRIDHRIQAMEARLAEKEEALYLEFARLEQALAVLNNQQAWLLAAISGLPAAPSAQLGA